MSGKFTVVIPTMWYSDKIHENLHRLNECDEVGEIILIDNNTTAKPSHFKWYEKLTYLPQKENIYVNPAWNLGVEKSIYEYICISNDDVLFNTDIFKFIKSHLESGIYGMSTENYYNRNPKQFEVYKIEERPWGWGCLFFIHKQNYKPINEDIKIACGDDWLIHYTKGGAWEIKGLDLGDDRVSTTAIKSEYLPQQQEDIKLWSQYLHSLTKDTNS